MIKVLTVFGTRPEAIKLAPVIKELERRSDVFDSRICVTAQHRELLDQMLELFDISPDYDLDIMTNNQSVTDVTVAVLSGLRRVLEAEQPDWVLVQGDTTTTMASGLGAFHHGSRVAHVEAGLRTFDQLNPWPEEMNRRVAGVVADLHFAPTAASVENLYREGISKERVYLTGNTIIDALGIVSAMPFDPRGTALAEIPLGGKRVVLMTLHRRETPPEAIGDVCAAVTDIAAGHEDVQIVCPIHPNPNVRQPILELLSGIPNITLLPPLDYRSMIWLLQRTYLVITDSGGLQEEVTALGKPVLVVREKTERTEGVAAGTAQLVGTNRHAIEASARRLLSDRVAHERIAQPTVLYGDGNAARKIADALRERSLTGGAHAVDREAIAAAAQGLRTWISAGSCQSPTGAFVAWVDLADHKTAYEYPEISGYALTYFAGLPSASEEEVAAGRRAADWLTARVQADDLAARDWWDNGAVYLFDLGMIASGLLSFGRLTNVERYVEAGVRLVDFLRDELSPGRPISAIARRGPQSDRHIWSTRGVPHLAKLVQAFLLAEELTGSGALPIAAELIEAAKRLQDFEGYTRTDPNTRTVMLHPHLYAAEGLWIWGRASGDQDALERASAAVKWVWAQQLEQGGLPRSVTASDTGAAACEQSDVTAQALRLALALGPPTAAVNRALARIIAVARRHVGGLAILYQPGSPDAHLSTWATLFAAQALAIALPEAPPLSWDGLV